MNQGEENSGDEEEDTAAANRSCDQSDISDSDIERDEQEVELDDSLQEPGSSKDFEASKCQQLEQESTSSSKSRKRKRGKEEPCSSRHLCAAEDKHIKESKMKHNKSEQLR